MCDVVENKVEVPSDEPCASDKGYMQIALELAHRAAKNGDVPVGAVVVCEGRVVGRGYNKRERNKDATAHAEVQAIRQACKKLGRWNLSDCDLYITLEPCAMCAGAIVNSRIRRVIFGALDKRFGCGGSLCNLLRDSGLNHQPIVLYHQSPDCGQILTDFFAALRKNKNPSKDNIKKR